MVQSDAGDSRRSPGTRGGAWQRGRASFWGGGDAVGTAEVCLGGPIPILHGTNVSKGHCHPACLTAFSTASTCRGGSPGGVQQGRWLLPPPCPVPPHHTGGLPHSGGTALLLGSALGRGQDPKRGAPCETPVPKKRKRGSVRTPTPRKTLTP